LKKLQLSPLVLVPAAVLLATVSFVSGDILHSYVQVPFIQTTNVDFSELNDIYGLMKRNFDGKIDDKAALDGAKAGLVAAGGDPYTTYLTQAQAKELDDDLNGKLSGIGAQIGTKNNAITVIAPVAGTPAEKAGIKAGDVIAKINNEDTNGMSVDTAVSKIRGKAGTQVKLKLYRPNTDPIELTITRADINVPSVTWNLKNGNVGYIQISTFGSDTASLMDKAAADLKSQGAQKIILDLRNNGGGYLDAGVSVASQFLDSGKTVVSERTNGKTTSTLDSQGSGKLVGLPTIVLVNGGSASASEIVSGALHDNGAAKLLGEKTFGKGSVQEMKDLPGGAELKVTIAHWYTPNGININKEGIKPDTEVKLTTDDYNNSRDPQLDKALEFLK